MRLTLDPVVPSIATDVDGEAWVKVGDRWERVDRPYGLQREFEKQGPQRRLVHA